MHLVQYNSGKILLAVIIIIALWGGSWGGKKK